MSKQSETSHASGALPNRRAHWPAVRQKSADAGGIILPSLLAAPPLRLGEELTSLAAADSEILHIDVMDGHFVPNLAFTPAQVRAIARAYRGALDVHLMLTRPLQWLESFVSAGASAITCHLEADDEPARVVAAIHRLGVPAGLSLRPATSLARLAALDRATLQSLDLVLLMAVEPGFGGQQLLPETLARLESLYALRAQWGAHFAIVVDGGVTLAHLEMLCLLGADACVVGTDLWRHPPIDARLARYREVLERFGGAHAAHGPQKTTAGPQGH